MTDIGLTFGPTTFVVAAALGLQTWTAVRTSRTIGDKMSMALFAASLALGARGCAAALGIMTADIMGEVVILAVSGALLAASYLQRPAGIGVDLFARVLTDKSPNPIMIKSPTGEYEYINDAFEAEFGVRSADIIGLKAEQIWDENISLAALESDKRVIATGQPSVHKVVFKLGDNEPQDWLITKFALPMPDGSMRIATAYTEFSEHVDLERRLAESEARIQTLLDNSPTPVYFKDLDLRFVMVNRCFTELYGVTPEQVIGKTSVEVHGTKEAEAFMAHDREVMEKRTLITREEIIKGDTYLTSKFPVINSAGELIGVGGIETDISERVTVERAYRQARDEAEAANRSKSAFLANMSHELRTPLNSIIGFSDSLLAGTLGEIQNPTHREYLSIIRDGGEHLLQLINDILDLSRIEAGKLALDEESVDLRAVFSDSIRLTAERAGNEGIYIDNQVPPELPQIMADERQLRQVLINLLSNAIKFTDPGGRITASASVLESGMLEIRVADTGVGIDAENLKLVQQPFVQVADAMTRKHKGSGLGLAIVKSIVNMHGGEFTLESELGVGTTAIITLPAARVLTGEG
ncbi:MAG: PAS domain-containing protein [Rhodospirillales bacterium]|nr:PAS domain-containing protein [Rhodospirillales bacterium]MBO6787086.1 PAS domain-containing protein [Rhodospirillales bacterium]